jgi:hypothetical protein
MNTITRTYSNDSVGFLKNLLPRASFDNKSQAPINDNKKLSPVVNTDYPDSNSQTSQIDKNSKQNNTGNNDTEKYSGLPSGNDLILNQAEMKLLEELKKTDTEVRQHEMAHITAGGQYITSGANFTYQRGPDGKIYAVGGEVGIDTSPVPGDPEATIKKMRQVKNAALAPVDPSSQDLKVAENATFEVSKSLSELMISQVKDKAAANEKKIFGNFKKAIDSYQKISAMPAKKISSFQIAV